MQALMLREGFYWTGIMDEKLRVFDIIMYTEFGTTYNSYVWKTREKTILFETVKEQFFDEYLEKLREVSDVTKIDYLVVSHTEPDHAGSIERLLTYSPQMKILATSCAIGFLREIVHRDFVGIAVRDEQKMEIGGKTLRFMLVPNLHWPDTMYTFIEEEQILVTCDSFGAHYCVPEVTSDGIKQEKDYQKALRYYYENIIGPFKSYMLQALDQVEHLDISMIATGHGPVLTGNRVRSVIEQYREWSTVVNPNQKKTVIIPYVSAYGYTARLAEKIREGIEGSGEIDVRLYDLVEADAAKVSEELSCADGFLLGTPTILGEALRPIWELTLGMYPVTHKGAYAGAFGSYGWSGEGVPHITERLKQLKLKVVDGFTVRFRPDESDLLSAYEYGYQFGCLVQEKEVKKPSKHGARHLVRCLVCNEIFDASLEVCPVCGVGREHFVLVEEEVSTFSNPTQEYYVILGNGAAGYYAAKAIRERDQTGTIVMISNEPYLSYHRPMLTKAIVTGLSAKQIEISDQAWYEEQKIFPMLSKEVVDVDLTQKEVILEDGSRVHFTKLVYALGSECFLPPVKGNTLPEVIAIRRLADVERLEELIREKKEAVVIGGGVLGLEAAWELRKAGLSVTVLEAAPVLMGRQLDTEAGAWLLQAAKKSGIEIRTGVKVVSIDGEGHVTGVTLEDGETLSAGLVVISAGVRPNVELAKKIGLETDRGVIVGDHMETNLAGIYACGDCAQYQGRSYGVWPEAVEEGKTAGANAAGEALEYTAKEPALTFHGMHTALFAAGDQGKNPNLLYKTMCYEDMGRGQYQKYYFLNDRLCGVILLGDLSSMARVTALLEQHASSKEVLHGS